MEMPLNYIESGRGESLPTDWNSLMQTRLFGRAIFLRANGELQRALDPQRGATHAEHLQITKTWPE